MSEQVERRGLTRRTFLQGAAATTVAGAASGAVATGTATAATAASGGTEPDTYDTDFVAGTGGATVPLRAPAGQLDFLDRNQYIHNMEIISFLPDTRITGGEPLISIWARGSQRLLSGAGGFVDVTDPTRPEAFETDAGNGNVVFNDRLKKWIQINDQGAPTTPPTAEFPRGKYHPEYAQEYFDYTGPRGIEVWDVTDPTNTQLLSEFSTGETGMGTHMISYDGGRYAYLDAGFDETLRMENDGRQFSNALMVVDMSDPMNVTEVSRWWVPGQRFGEEEEYFKYPFAGDQVSWTCSHGAPILPKRVEDGGTVGYGGWGHFGMIAHDFSDIRNPGVYGIARHPLEARGSIPYHTVYPVNPGSPGGGPRRFRDLVIGVNEALMPDLREDYHTSYVIDAKDPRNPKIIGLFPRPLPHPDAPYADFSQARGRFGYHNAQAWVAPGRARPEIHAFSAFVAGIRLYDINDPTEPREVAYFVPPRGGDISDYGSWRRGTGETVVIEWDRNLIWFGARGDPGGTYCLSSPALGEPVLKPRPVTEWSVPHVNRGHDG